MSDNAIITIDSRNALAPLAIGEMFLATDNTLWIGTASGNKQILTGDGGIINDESTNGYTAPLIFPNPVTGRPQILIGNTLPNFDPYIGATSIEIQGSVQAALGIQTYSATSSQSQSIEFIRSRNATRGSNTIVQDGDRLGRIVFEGANGSTYTRAAEIIATVNGTPGASNDMPGKLSFLITPDGSGTPAEALSINAAKGVTLGGSVISYGGIATEGKGVPPIHNLVAVTNSSASISATNLTNTNASGVYRVSLYLHSNSDVTGTGNVTATILWDARSYTTAACTLTTATAYQEHTFIVFNESGASMQYSTTRVATGSYGLYIAVERLN